MRQIRIDIYTGFADAPRAYDKMKITLTERYDIERVKEDISKHIERMIEDLEDIDDDTNDY
jgi:hypothetical protein